MSRLPASSPKGEEAFSSPPAFSLCPQPTLNPSLLDTPHIFPYNDWRYLPKMPSTQRKLLRE